MNALEEFRSMIEEHWPHSDPSWREGEMKFAPTIDAIADRIEAEWMELPKDADGKAIHVGDMVEIEYGPDGAVEVYGVNDHAVYVQSGCYGSGLVRLVRSEPPDTQERIDQDARKGPCEYFGHDDMSCSEGGECRAASFHDGCYTHQRLDLLRRQRELDGRKDEQH